MAGYLKKAMALARGDRRELGMLLLATGGGGGVESDKRTRRRWGKEKRGPCCGAAAAARGPRLMGQTTTVAMSPCSSVVCRSRPSQGFWLVQKSPAKLLQLEEKGQGIPPCV